MQIFFLSKVKSKEPVSIQHGLFIKKQTFFGALKHRFLFVVFKPIIVSSHVFFFSTGMTQGHKAVLVHEAGIILYFFGLQMIHIEKLQNQ